MHTGNTASIIILFDLLFFVWLTLRLTLRHQTCTDFITQHFCCTDTVPIAATRFYMTASLFLYDCQVPDSGTTKEQTEEQAQWQSAAVNCSQLSPLLAGFQRYPVPLRAALVSLSARGKEVGHVGLVQLGRLVKGIHKELDDRWIWPLTAQQRAKSQNFKSCLRWRRGKIQVFFQYTLAAPHSFSVKPVIKNRYFHEVLVTVCRWTSELLWMTLSPGAISSPVRCEFSNVW